MCVVKPASDCVNFLEESVYCNFYANEKRAIRPKHRLFSNSNSALLRGIIRHDLCVIYLNTFVLNHLIIRNVFFVSLGYRMGPKWQVATDDRGRLWYWCAVKKKVMD